MIDEVPSEARPTVSAAARHVDLVDHSAAELRRVVRRGEYGDHTAGLAPGRLQCNLAILPSRYSDDFASFCAANPAPCPVIAQGVAGNPLVPELGADLDVSTDAPRYDIHMNGEVVETRQRVDDIWRDDLTAFAIGCSFTFERALMEAGIAMPHIERDVTVPMYRTSVLTAPVGPFGGAVVMSMRPIPNNRIAETIDISSRYPHAHGAPLHVGDPADIGIRDLAEPDWGVTVLPGRGETPVFWGCGVTPQTALARARLPFAITHRPGCMLVTDLDERGLNLE